MSRALWGPWGGVRFLMGEVVLYGGLESNLKVLKVLRKGEVFAHVGLFQNLKGLCRDFQRIKSLHTRDWVRTLEIWYCSLS